MPPLQDIIHKLEVAGGVRYVRYALAFLIGAFLIVSYNGRIARNMATQEAMDAAQLGRNLADGKGYTTLFVRPFSMHLVSERNRERFGIPVAGTLADYARIRQAHPDISNPPVYPVVLAGLMKVLPFDYSLSSTKPFWSATGRSWRSQPDFLISWFNELLFFGIILLTYLWARRLFDAAVATVSAILLFGSEMLWQFSTAGLSTILLLLIFMGLVWCLTLLEADTWEPRRSSAGLMGLSAAIGALVGLGTLTRYGFGFVIVPTLVFVGVFTGPRRVRLLLVTAAAFLVVTVPWIVRTYNLSGAPFGTATYDIFIGPTGFPDYQLERSLDPQIRFAIRPLVFKLLINARAILQHEFFTLAGGWLTALFLAGLLVGFRNPTIRRLRYFVLWSLGTLLVVQALGRTQLSEDSPQINSENFLVLVVPLVVVYAVSLFYTLLDQIRMATRQLRYVAIGLFVLLSCLPLLFALLPPRSIPIVYPPYLPSAIQKGAGWLREKELMMSDIPWAVAWYGRRQCVWLTLRAMQDPANPDSHENFFAINDLDKPINALYLSAKTMDFGFETGIIRGGDASWGALALNVLLRRGRDEQVPAPFPLRESNPDFFADGQLYLSDWKRWKQSD